METPLAFYAVFAYIGGAIRWERRPGLLMKFLLGLGFILALAVSAQAQVTRIVAVVNNDIVTADDIDARMNLIMRTSGIPDTPQNRQQLASRVLQTLIDEKLEMQEAARFKVSVDKNEINKALSNIEARNNMPKGGLDDYLKRLGIDRRSLVDQITASLTWNKVVQARYASDVSVSDAEVNDDIARIKADIGKPQSHMAEIFLAVDNPTQDAEVKALADRLINQIRSGANFAALAQQFSQSPTAATGGDIGWVTPTQFGPPLDEAIAKMNPGQISYPIRTPAGYYILLLIDRRTPARVPRTTRSSAWSRWSSRWHPARRPQTSSASPRRRSMSPTRRRAAARWRRSPAKRRRSFRTQTPNVRAGDLPPDLRATVLALKVGEASKPLPARGGIGVVMVCQRNDPASPVAGATTRSMIKSCAQRLDQMARRYLRDLRRDAYVDIRRMTAPLALTMGEPAGHRRRDHAARPGCARGEAGLPPFFVLDDPDRLGASCRDAAAGRSRRRPSPLPRKPPRSSLDALARAADRAAAARRAGQARPRQRARRHRRHRQGGRSGPERPRGRSGHQPDPEGDALRRRLSRIPATPNISPSSPAA